MHNGFLSNTYNVMLRSCMYTIDEQYDSTMYAASYCYLIAASAVYISVVQTFSNRKKGKKATCKKAT